MMGCPLQSSGITEVYVQCTWAGFFTCTLLMLIIMTYNLQQLPGKLYFMLVLQPMPLGKADFSFNRMPVVSCDHMFGIIVTMCNVWPMQM